MRKYGTIHCSFWTSENIRRLSDDARTVALYLLTGPHTTMIGCFRLPDGYAAEDLAWPIERVTEALSELDRNGFATRHEPSKLVFIPNFLEWNRVENANQGKAAAKLFDALPDVPVKYLVARDLRSFAKFFPAEVLVRFEGQPKGLGEPFSNQKQKQEQEQDQGRDPSQEGADQEVLNTPTCVSAAEVVVSLNRRVR
jgi:hypothetical protein